MGAATESRPYKTMEKFKDIVIFKDVGAGLCARPLTISFFKKPSLELL